MEFDWFYFILRLCYQRGFSMKKFILGLVFCLSSFSFGWYPSTNSHLIRVIGTSPTDTAFNLSSYSIEGQMFSKKIDQKNLEIGSLYKLGDNLEDGKIGAFVSYQINDLVALSVSGDTTSGLDLGAGFCIHAFLPIHRTVKVIPFMQVDVNRVGGGGLIFDFELSKVKFEIGAGFTLPTEANPAPQISFLIGTSLDPLSSFNAL